MRWGGGDGEGSKSIWLCQKNPSVNFFGCNLAYFIIFFFMAWIFRNVLLWKPDDHCYFVLVLMFVFFRDFSSMLISEIFFIRKKDFVWKYIIENLKNDLSILIFNFSLSTLRIYDQNINFVTLPLQLAQTSWTDKLKLIQK